MMVVPDDDEDWHGGGEGDGDPGQQKEEGGDKDGNLSPKPLSSYDDLLRLGKVAKKMH